MSKLTQTKLKEIVHYDPETGVFTWKINYNKKKKVGSKLAEHLSHGYIKLGMYSEQYAAHKLAFLYMEGYFPENDIDHIDKNRVNNKWNNLREISRSCNLRNTNNPKDNTSGVKGVAWNKQYSKWVVNICVNRSSKFLGYYDDFDEAACVRLAGEQCLDWDGCDFNSPAYQHVQKMLKKIK